MTKRALMAIAEDAAATAPYWRITKPNGAMMTYFPGGPAGQARSIRREQKRRHVADNAAAQLDNQTDLPHLTKRLVRIDAQNKLRAATIIVRDVHDEPEKTKLLAAIADLQQRLSLEPLPNIEWPEEPVPQEASPTSTKSSNVLTSVRRELHVYMRFLRQVEIIFCSMSSEQIWKATVSLGLVEQLAKARQSLEVGLGVTEFLLQSLDQNYDQVN